jgi:dTMP kinase
VRGRFITFEGGEGTGKSTQTTLLGRRLVAAGRTVVETREPGGTPLAERIRELVLTAELQRSVLAEALLFSAARADHVDACIRPALQRGAWVVSDRFADSTRAYQGAAAGLPAATIDSLEQLAVADCRPDLTVVLDLPAAVGLARATARRDAARRAGGADAFESRVVAFHERLRQGFLAIAAAEPQRCLVVDATQSADVIADEVWRIVVVRFGAELA